MANRLGEPLTEIELAAFLDQQIQQARLYLESTIAGDRSKNLRGYLRRPFGNEVDGRSQVISSDISDTVDGLMPDLMDIFAGGGEIIKFAPTGREDEDMAQQASDYVNDVVLHQDNDGYLLVHDWIKDTLLEKNGVIKCWWDESEETKTEHYTGVTVPQLMAYIADPYVEVTEWEPGEPVTVMDGAEPIETMNITLERTERNGRCKLQVIGSEWFIISARDIALDEDTRFCAQRHRLTRSDLVEMGWDAEYVWNLPSDDGEDDVYGDSRRIRQARFSDKREALRNSYTLDQSMRTVRVYETYPLMDVDGSGIAKRYRVWTAGTESTVVMPDPDTGDLWTEVADHPFVDMMAIRQPHRWTAIAVADLVREIMLIKSTIQRQTLDNVYQINNQRNAISNKVSLDDYLNNEVGGAVLVDTNTADVGGHIADMAPQFIGQATVPLLEYWDQILEKRTGVSLTQALDPEALHETATGANLILGEVQKRMTQIARMMAVTGFARLGKKILKVIVDNQDFARTVRLRGEWVEIAPDRWNADMDVEPVVGLGHGTRADKLASLQMIKQDQATLLASGKPELMAMVSPENVWNTAQGVVDAAGLGDAEVFFTDPAKIAQSPQQPPSPDSKLIEVQAKMHLEQQKAQAQAMLEKYKADQQFAIAKYEADQKVALEQAKAAAELGLKRDELAIEAELEVVKMAVGDPAGQGDIPQVT